MPKNTTPLERLAEHMAEVAVWHARHVPHPPTYAPGELERHLGHSMRALAQPLLLSGWQRTIVFSRKSWHPVSRTLWLPPGSPHQPPKRGRPSFNLFQLLGI